MALEFSSDEFDNLVRCELFKVNRSSVFLIRSASIFFSLLHKINNPPPYLDVADPHK